MRYQYHQSGTGPFALESYLPGELIVLRRFAGYADVSTNVLPMTGEEIDRVEFSVITDLEADLLALGSAIPRMWLTMFRHPPRKI